MSFQSASDDSTSSNSPTLVQANPANFEMLDLTKTESGPLRSSRKIVFNLWFFDPTGNLT